MIFAAIVDAGGGVVDIDLAGVHSNIIMVNIVQEGLTAKNFSDRLAMVSRVNICPIRFRKQAVYS